MDFVAEKSDLVKELNFVRRNMAKRRNLSKHAAARKALRSASTLKIHLNFSVPLAQPIQFVCK